MNNRNLIIFGSLLLIIGLWIFSWYFIDTTYPSNEIDYQSNRGAFGDKFGFINSLFSGLALTGIIISIYFQQIELSLQRRELSDTRKEFKDQNFQTTFFNLLKTQRQLADEINCNVFFLRSYDQELNSNVQGRQFFITSKSEMKKIIKALDHNKYIKYTKWDEYDEYEHQPQSAWEADELSTYRQLAFIFYNYNITNETYDKYKASAEIDKAIIVYNIFFEKYRYVIGHYFRHLYHIFSFLEKEQNDNGDKDEIINFSNFIQAQMSTPEMFLLYYNCLKFPKMKNLVIKFKILENLSLKDLISEEHKLTNITLG